MPDPINELQPTYPIYGPDYTGPGIVGDVPMGSRVLRADRTGARDATDSIRNLINSAIEDRCDCFIPAGTYKITPGQLVFECGATETPFPMIRTDGAYKTVFVVDSASTVDAPIFEIKNSTQSKYWLGGGFGGVGFVDTVNANYTKRHAISACGWRAPLFEHLRGQSLNGAVFYLPQRAVGNNPDPYAVSNLHIGILDATECDCAMLNENGVGLTDYNFRRVRSIRTRSGGIRGLGIGGVVQSIGAGDCTGWLIEDLGGTQGPVSKFTLGTAEIDSCQYGIRVGACLMMEFRNVRFVHRKNAGRNANEGYWPRVCVQLAETINGLAGHVRDVNIYVWNRIEPGGTLANLGVFVSGSSNGNISNVTINQRLQDNASTGVQDTALFTAFQSICKATYGRVNGKLVLNLDNTV